MAYIINRLKTDPPTDKIKFVKRKRLRFKLLVAISVIEFIIIIYGVNRWLL